MISTSRRAIPPHPQPSLGLRAQLPGLGKKGRLFLSPPFLNFAFMGSLDYILQASRDLGNTATAAQGKTRPSGDTRPFFLPPAGGSVCSVFPGHRHTSGAPELLLPLSINRT